MVQMIRLHLVVEGQSEEAFVNSILTMHLGQFNISADARCVETSRQRSWIHRGGLLDFARAKRDLARWMKEDPNPDAYFTTMFDLFRLPEGFPAQSESRRLPDPYQRVVALEAALSKDIDHPRFVPYIQLHEFEALLLCDPQRLDLEFIGHAAEIRELVRICERFESPELIDDGPQTAPSKRIIAQIPAYDGRKASVAPRVISEIGLNLIREKCRHFDQWLQKLERLGRSAE